MDPPARPRGRDQHAPLLVQLDVFILGLITRARAHTETILWAQCVAGLQAMTVRRRVGGYERRDVYWGGALVLLSPA